MIGNLRLLYKEGKRIKHTDLKNHRVNLNYTEMSGRVTALLIRNLEEYINTSEEVEDVYFVLSYPTLKTVQGNALVFAGQEIFSDGTTYGQEWWFRVEDGRSP